MIFDRSNGQSNEIRDVLIFLKRDEIEELLKQCTQLLNKDVKVHNDVRIHISGGENKVFSIQLQQED